MAKKPKAVRIEPVRVATCAVGPLGPLLEHNQELCHALEGCASIVLAELLCKMQEVDADYWYGAPKIKESAIPLHQRAARTQEYAQLATIGHVLNHTIFALDTWSSNNPRNTARLPEYMQLAQPIAPEASVGVAIFCTIEGAEIDLDAYGVGHTCYNISTRVGWWLGRMYQEGVDCIG